MHRLYLTHRTKRILLVTSLYEHLYTELMIIRFTYGFEHKGIIYGWKDKELHRLPQMIGKRFYPLRKCGKWNDSGYYLGAEKKSFAQLKSMTVFINREVEEISSKDTPF